MSLVLSSSFLYQFKLNDSSFHRTCSYTHKLWFPNKPISLNLKNKSPRNIKFESLQCMVSSSNGVLGEDSGDDWSDDVEDGGFDEMESPWEGAVVYQRNASVSHVEYCTTLERLGLGELSTEVSKSRASLMGLRVTKAVKDFPLGTPVLVSVDVTRKKRKLRLDGIIRTVLTLGCNRCGQPAAECVFSNFSVLLTEEPIEEPDTIDMGVIFGDSKTSGSEEEDDEASIDWEDRLFFPPEDKSIDISKHVRDMVHLEITINSLCDPTCKGLCLNCGTNLNLSSCSCSKQKVKEKGYGPLGDLKERMRQS